MKSIRVLATGLLALFLSTHLIAAAKADFSGGLKLASHYAWQGGTESNEEPVLQGSMYYNFSSCYVGFWASGTGSESDYAGTEIDYETGCGGSLMENVGWNVDFLYLTYPGATNGNNLVELRLKLSADLGIASAWARLGLPKWGDNDGATNTSGHNRPQVGFTVPLGDTPISVSATFGQDNKRRNCDDYDWYHFSVDTSVQGFGLSAFYSGRGDRDPRCSNGSVKAGDEIAGISISRGF